MVAHNDNSNPIPAHWKRGGLRAAFSALGAAAVVGCATIRTAPVPQPGARDTVTSSTALSQRLDALNKSLNKAVPEARIVMMDRDWLTKNLALRQISPVPAVSPGEAESMVKRSSWKFASDSLAKRDPDAFMRQKLLADFTATRARVPAIDPARMGILSLMANVTNAQGFAILAGSGSSEGLDKNHTFCTVFGEFADMDAEAITREEIGLIQPGLLPDLDKRKLINVMPLAVLRKGVNYHEAGHCYYQAVRKAKSQSLNDVIKFSRGNEIYGDIMRVLLLAHFDGFTQAGDRLADQRLSEAALATPFYLRNIDPHSMEYYRPFNHITVEGLRAAQKMVDSLGMPLLKKMSTRDVFELGFKILDRVPQRGYADACAVNAMLYAKFDTSFVSRLHGEHPGCDSSVAYALKMKDEINEALPRVFDLRGFDPNKTPLEQIRFDAPPGPVLTTEQQDLLAQNRRDGYSRDIIWLRNRLVNMAGGPDRADDAALSGAYDLYVNFLRDRLETGQPAERLEAMRFLPLMDRALREAAIQVDGPKPVPVNVPRSP